MDEFEKLNDGAAFTMRHGKMAKPRKRRVRRFLCGIGRHRVKHTTLGAARFTRASGEYIERWGEGRACWCRERSSRTLEVDHEVISGTMRIAGEGVLATDILIKRPVTIDWSEVPEI